MCGGRRPGRARGSLRSALGVSEKGQGVSKVWGVSEGSLWWSCGSRAGSLRMNQAGIGVWAVTVPGGEGEGLQKSGVRVPGVFGG